MFYSKFFYTRHAIRNLITKPFSS